MSTLAVVLPHPEKVELRQLELSMPVGDHLVIETAWSGISTGTERLFWSGRMPPFPGLGYPLVPGYETVGRVSKTCASSRLREGDLVFVPGANCYGEVRGLFGGAASRLAVLAERVTPIDEALGEKGVLLALAATAQHALMGGGTTPVDLIVGHGALGRLLARLAVARGDSPVVWETNPARLSGAVGYSVIDPETDPRRDYRSVYDVSGDVTLIETLLGRLARGGEIVLAGFYSGRVDFAFPLAFLKEARLRVSAEWQPADLKAVVSLVFDGRLDLDGLITHRRDAQKASEAYESAFTDADCLKMVMDWSSCR